MRAAHGRRLPNFWIGLIAILLIVVGLYMSFAKELPWSSGYEIKGVFKNAQQLAEKSPVRIAGVNVGQVRSVEPLPGQNAALVTMRITDAGRPIHEDARMQLRPRLFLEGNLFVDLHPGSPSAPELEDGAELPIQQTSNSVQLDQILTTLQSDVRGNLQLFLKELGDAFDKYGGAEGFRLLYKTGGPAYKNTALVNEAFLGTEPHDLSGLIRNFDTVARALNENEEQLKDLVTNLRIFTGSFAAEDAALAAAVHELPLVLDQAEPAFDNLNEMFPSLRAFAIEALPGTRTAPATLDVALPFIRQLRALVSADELRGLTADLRPTIPNLALLNRRQIPFMEQARALSSCFTQVIIPWGNDKVEGGGNDASGDPIYPVYEETGYGLAGIAGESRSGDANGQYIRVGLGVGPNTVFAPATTSLGQTVGLVPFRLLGSEPVPGPKTPLRPTVPCENQERPNLNSRLGPAPPQGRVGSTVDPLAGSPLAPLAKEYGALLKDLMAAEKMDGRRGAIAVRKALDAIEEFNKETADEVQEYFGTGARAELSEEREGELDATSEEQG